MDLRKRLKNRLRAIEEMRRLPQTALPLIGLMIPAAGFATNGLNQIGFGAEWIAMGGADIAVARDTSALNVNPARIAQITGSLAELNAAVAYAGNISHRDAIANDTDNSNEYPLLGKFGYQ